MDAKKRELILNGDMRKVLIVLALPIMLGNLIQTAYNITDTYFVSRLGDIEVASVGFVWNLIFLIISLGLGLSVAGRSMIAQYVGADDEESAKQTAGQMFSFMATLGIGFSIIFYILAPYIIRLMGAEGELYRYSLQYLRIILLGMPFQYLFFSFNAIKNGRGDMVTPMIISAVAVVLNIILDPICIFVLDWGVPGAAIATTTARILISIVIMAMLYMGKFGLKLRLPDFKFHKETIVKMLKIGVPVSLGQATAALGFTIMTAMVKSFGEMTLTAYVIGSRVNSVVLMPLMGIGWALTTVAGQNIGAGKIDRVRQGFRTSIAYSLLFALVGGSLMALATSGIVKIFSDNPTVIEQGTYFLYVIIFALPTMGIFQTLIGIFQGTGHTKFSSMLMIGRLWVLRIPMILLFKNFTSFEEKSVWYSIILSNIVVCIVGIIGYLSGLWKKKTI